MKESLRKLLQDREFVDRLAACQSEAAMQALLQEAGVQVSLEEVAAALETLGGNRAEGELSEEELSAVAGGSDLSLVDGKPEGQMTEVHEMLNHMVEQAYAATNQGCDTSNRHLTTREEMEAQMQQAMKRDEKPLNVQLPRP